MHTSVTPRLFSTIYTAAGGKVARERQENGREIMRVSARNPFTLPAGDMKRGWRSAEASDPGGMSFDADEMAPKTNARNSTA
jgi:hypothetical protein